MRQPTGHPYVFHPTSISFSDDAIHTNESFSNIETWYYDAIFENGYSIVSLINIIHIGRIGTVLSGVFIYKDGILLKQVRKRYPLRWFVGSNETVRLTLHKKDVVKGIITDDNQWIYTITRGDNNNGFHLKFLKTMKPFKGTTHLGKWLVIPGFSVEGTIYINGKKIQAKGTGYHDHNIYPLKAPFITKGYFFGKLVIQDSKIIWAQIQKNKKTCETLAVLSKENKFASIHPDNIHLIIHETRKDHRKTIPYSCRLTINDPLVQVDVQFSPETYHHLGIPATHYWRYHQKYTGSYMMNQKSGHISTYDVVEYLHFF